MATGWETLGNALGGNSEAAYQEGRYRSAQTEDALLRARGRQLENKAAETIAAERAGIDTKFAEAGFEHPTLYGALVRGEINPQQFMAARQTQQNIGLTATAANPETGALERTRALGALSGKPYSDLAPIGAGGVTNLTQDVPAVDSTPLGQSMVDENLAQASAANSLADLRTAQRTNPEQFRAAGGDRAGIPAGWERDPADPTRVRPIPGGPNDPSTDKPMGAREASFFNRIVGSANATRYDLKNIMSLPSGASVGVLGTGVGASPGTGLFEATGGNLRALVAPTEVRQYNTMLGGMNRALSFIEGQGLAGSNTLAASYDNLTLRPTDTVGDKMMKIAQVKQTVIAGIEPQLVSNRVPQAQKAYIQDLINDLNETIPFEVEDVIRFQNASQNNPTLTMGEAIGRTGLMAPRPTATPAQMQATPEAENLPTFATEAEAEAAGLAPGTRVVIGGVTGTWQ